ncbi:MFS transporter [bacterium]|nr:MFS transporter [bacterium]
MAILDNWQPENEQFWQEKGRKIAQRNLWISVPSLLCAFAVWLFWSIIIVQMQNLGYSFTTAQLYTLPAIAGLTGATLRIPNSFLIGISGGRIVIAVTTGLLLIPAVGTGIALKDMNTPFSTFALMAALSGIGGGNFASSMSNISFFYPKRMQGTALGINAGLGNIGVSVMQVLLPFVMTIGLFQAVTGNAFILKTATSGMEAGKQIWIQNSGFVWVPFLILLTILAWFRMDTMANHKHGSSLSAVSKVIWLKILGLASAGVGLLLLLRFNISMWIVLPLTIILTLQTTRWLTPKKVSESLKSQYSIFRNHHTWTMTWLYVMTFGSFIGYSAAFPKLIQDVFGTLSDGTINANAPNPFAYAWLGPLVGSLARPIGGWMSDKWGGAKITQWDTIVMIAAALGVAWTVINARMSASPETWFLPFLGLFLILFITTGIGNGSTFQMVPGIFKPEQAGPVLGWTSAVAAYGAFIIPKIFGNQIEAGHPEYALYGFAVYYFTCLVVNWYFYARKGALLPQLDQVTG